MSVTHGGLSFEELESMPYDEFLSLLSCCKHRELEQLRDIAFLNPTALAGEKDLKELRNGFVQAMHQLEHGHTEKQLQRNALEELKAMQRQMRNARS